MIIYIRDNELNIIDSNMFLNKIKKIIDKKIKSNTKYSDYILKQKIMTDLINLGYYKDDISYCLENIKVNNENLIDSAYDKLYKKLAVKYHDKELYQKIKIKLYQKGFSISEIDEIINQKIN